MRKTIKIKANLPSKDFLPLMEICSVIFNSHINLIFDDKITNKKKLHELLYFKLRQQFKNIPSGLIQSTRDLAVEAAKSTNMKFKPLKSKTSGVRFDKRNCSLNKEKMILTLSTLDKRVKIPIKIPSYFQDVFDSWKFTGLQLTYDNLKKQFFVCLNFKMDDPKILNSKNERILGIDRGLKNTIYCSNGYSVSGKRRNSIKRKYAFNRKNIQSKGTKSSRKNLRASRGREVRFSTNENHIISKNIVSLPYDTFILENLKGIRKKSKGKRMNRKVSNWPFYQFETFLKYKCIEKGKQVKYIDPSYTSQMCNKCGCIDKDSRKGIRYECTNCEVIVHSDYNASKNIRNLYKLRIDSIPSVIKTLGQGQVKGPKANSSKKNIAHAQGSL